MEGKCGKWWGKGRKWWEKGGKRERGREVKEERD